MTLQATSTRDRDAVTDPHHTDDLGADEYSGLELLFVRMREADDSDECQRWRRRIIAQVLPVADHIAYRFVGRGEPADDLVQVARLGLIKAVDRFDPQRGHFLGFAVPTIVGAVRRYFRDNTWSMHVPRRLKENQQRVRTATGPLAQRLGRAPTAAELAAELAMDCEEVVQSLASANAYRPLSLDSAMPPHLGSGTPMPADQGAEDAGYAKVEDVMTVAVLVRHLSDRERLIVVMRFSDCLTQAEIAQRLGISQVHVSRLLSDCLSRLRNQYWTEPSIDKSSARHMSS